MISLATFLLTMFIYNLTISPLLFILNSAGGGREILLDDLMVWDYVAPPPPTLPPSPAHSSRSSSKAFSASGQLNTAHSAANLPPPPMISISPHPLHKSQPPPLISNMSEVQLMSVSPKMAFDYEASAPTLHDYEVGSQKSVPVSAVPDAGLVFPSKYDQLLMALQEMSKDIRPSYGGSKISVERLKRNITQARILIREALNESDYCNKFD